MTPEDTYQQTKALEESLTELHNVLQDILELTREMNKGFEKYLYSQST